MDILVSKLKDVFIAVFPIVVFVVALSFTIAPVPGMLLIQFIIGAAFIMMGLSILLAGVDLGFLPLGKQMGGTVLKLRKIPLIAIASFVLGFFVVMTEPSVQVLAAQVANVSGGRLPMGLILLLVATGAGVMLAIGMARMSRNISQRIVFYIVLAAIFILTLFATPDMMAITFDAVGATTGAVTVPFILAIALGASALNTNSKEAEENSFGLVGLTALGASFGILILNLFMESGDAEGVLEIKTITEGSLLAPFIAEIPGVAVDAVIMMLPIFIIFFISQKFKIDFKSKVFSSMFVGFLLAYVGLFLFFIGVNGGFMNTANIVGYGVASFGNNGIIVGSGFLLGMLIVLTEPAVYVFTHQIEDITKGKLTRKQVLLFLAIGVSCSVGLIMLRIVIPGLMLWHFLLAGVIAISILLAVAPKLFVGICFDSGAVSAGPMTATFALAFAQGVSEAVEHSNVMVDSFGVIAMVTMMPIIAMLVLGFIFKMKSKNEAL